MANYITYFYGCNSVYAQYHNNGIIIGDNDLRKIMGPNIFDAMITLRDSTRNVEMLVLNDRLSNPLIESRLSELRIFLARCLVFIHTWTRENNQLEILSKHFFTYDDFFSDLLQEIERRETVADIKLLATQLNFTRYHLRDFLCDFGGDFSSTILPTREFTQIISLLSLVT